MKQIELYAIKRESDRHVLHSLRFVSKRREEKARSENQTVQTMTTTKESIPTNNNAEERPAKEREKIRRKVSTEE